MATKKTTTTAKPNKAVNDLAAKSGVSTPATDQSDILGETTYIGVPTGYKAYNPNTVTKTTHNYGSTFINTNAGATDPSQLRGGIAPAYAEGSQYALASAPPEQIRQMQDHLVEAGLLDGDFSYGTWDKTTAAAYKQVLALANQSGIDAGTALNQFLDNPVTSKAAAARAPLVVHLTSDDDLRAIINQVSTQTNGIGLSPAEASQFIAAYHATEKSQQTSAYNDAVSGGTVTDPANPQVAAAAFARQLHPDRASATDFASQAGTFLDMIDKNAPKLAQY